MESIEAQAAEASGRRARGGPAMHVGPGNPSPKESGGSPVTEAFAYLNDRNERLSIMIGQLDDVVDRAWRVLQDVIPEDASTQPLPGDGSVSAKVSQINERQSTIARRVTGLAENADLQADQIALHTRRLELLLDAVQL